MRKPAEIERLYLDFDCFFAAVAQQVTPALRGRPVGIVPFAGTDRTCIIACSREAKLQGVKNVMSVQEALALCRDLILVPQVPDLYRRAHNALISEINAVLPVDAIKSIDEITCRVAPIDRADPLALGRRIKQRIAKEVSSIITCSIGFGANRQLAKMACKAGKRGGDGYGDGNLAWHPPDMPAPLLALELEDIPGIGARMKERLAERGIASMRQLLATQPKHMRKLWGNVTGERLWYALHGYDVQAPRAQRGMYGHGRVLPPDHRSLDEAHQASRLLLVKAARRMRRDGYRAGALWLWLSIRDSGWSGGRGLAEIWDDHAALMALEELWREARQDLPPRTRVIQIGVTLGNLTSARVRQLDFFADDDRTRRRWEAITESIDALNRKHGRTLVSLGPWMPPPGGYAGGKISYTRIPRIEDFW
ncbi:MAG: type VI secretion protein ImpB [Alphaproteobacteria bacterium]|nr:type VI secretion protein ImpB [Alphaproteobacteria bacterium]